MIGGFDEPRPLPDDIPHLRELVDCRCSLKLGALNGRTREINDCIVALVNVSRRRWEGIQVAVMHSGASDHERVDFTGGWPSHVQAAVQAIVAGGHTHTEVIHLGDITKVWVGWPRKSDDDPWERVALLECSGVHPYAHIPGIRCSIHFHDEPDQPSSVDMDADESMEADDA